VGPLTVGGGAPLSVVVVAGVVAVVVGVGVVPVVVVGVVAVGLVVVVTVVVGVVVVRVVEDVRCLTRWRRVVRRRCAGCRWDGVRGGLE
jgi:hypothetical protein